MGKRFGVNIILATITTLVAFLASMQNNTVGTSLIRGLLTFLVIFIILIPIRGVLAKLLQIEPAETHPPEALEDDETKGQSIDLTTPDEEVTHPFQPLDLTGISHITPSEIPMDEQTNATVEAVRQFMN